MIHLCWPHQVLFDTPHQKRRCFIRGRVPQALVFRHQHFFQLRDGLEIPMLSIRYSLRTIASQKFFTEFVRRMWRPGRPGPLLGLLSWPKQATGNLLCGAIVHLHIHKERSSDDATGRHCCRAPSRSVQNINLRPDTPQVVMSRIFVLSLVMVHVMQGLLFRFDMAEHVDCIYKGLRLEGSTAMTSLSK